MTAEPGDPIAGSDPTERMSTPVTNSNRGVEAVSPGSGLRSVGPYRIVRELGRGGQGAVYLGEDQRLRRSAAVKLLTSASAASPIERARFLREAEAVSRVDHPGLCTIFDIGEHDGCPWIAMRFIDGAPLSSSIAAAREARGDDRSSVVELAETDVEEDVRRAAPLTSERNGAKPAARSDPLRIARVLLLVENAARALHAAHEASVVHRDVKPQNIMVDRRGRPTVVDFGLAAELDGFAGLTQQGECFGTPAYMSPEQLSGGRLHVDRRTDVWSLGVTLYECLTLRRPFEEPTRERLFHAIETAEPPDPCALNRRLPSDLGVVLATALEKDGDRRYATALIFAEELRRVRCSHPIVARPAGVWIKLKKFARRNPVVAGLLGLLFATLSCGVATATYLYRDSKHEAAAKTTALAGYERLRVAAVAQELKREAPYLRPSTPDRLAAIERWLATAGGLTVSLGERRREVAELETKALPEDDQDRLADAAASGRAEEEVARFRAERDGIERLLKAEALPEKTDPESSVRREKDKERFPSRMTRAERIARLSHDLREADRSMQDADRRIGRRTAFRFADEESSFKHLVLCRFIAEAEHVVGVDGSGGLRAEMERRRAFAAGVLTRSFVRPRSLWIEAVREIRDPTICPRYAGLVIEPQSGLVPIGRDPESGLWEFVQLETHAAADDAPPSRGPDGRLMVRECDGLVFVVIPGGAFDMGATPVGRAGETSGPNIDPGASTDEAPVRRVALSPFFISKFEMTRAQWRRIVGYDPSAVDTGEAYRLIDFTRPVQNLSWNEAHDGLGGVGLRLPTEAQWEYAARAGRPTVRWFGDDEASCQGRVNLADSVARRLNNVNMAADDRFHDGMAWDGPVGSFPPNDFGLHEVLGNVWEWCEDGQSSYVVDPRAGDGLRLDPELHRRVLRGGSWESVPPSMRSADRAHRPPTYRHNGLGVRPARALDPLSRPR